MKIKYFYILLSPSLETSKLPYCISVKWYYKKFRGVKTAQKLYFYMLDYFSSHLHLISQLFPKGKCYAKKNKPKHTKDLWHRFPFFCFPLAVVDGGFGFCGGGGGGRKKEGGGGGRGEGCYGYGGLGWPNQPFQKPVCGLPGEKT